MLAELLGVGATATGASLRVVGPGVFFLMHYCCGYFGRAHWPVLNPDGCALPTPTFHH